MKKEQIIIIGGGPCGLAAAIALKEVGQNPLVIEKGNIVHALYNFPTHQTFYSTSDRLEIGDVPFVTENYKPKRNEALVYYREVVNRKHLRINTYEKATAVEKQHNGDFLVVTDKDTYNSKFVVIATGYYDHPNHLQVPGEELPKVTHYFKESHPYFDKDVAVVGGKNSSVDASLELAKAGARVTVLYRGTQFSPSIKPWVLPEFESQIKSGKIIMEFNSVVKEIQSDKIIYEKDGIEKELKNDFVLAMTGYHPDHEFLRGMGVHIEESTGRPAYNEETMETNVAGIFVAGVIAAGNNANEIFIENGRFHGDQIAAAIINEKVGKN